MPDRALGYAPHERIGFLEHAVFASERYHTCRREPDAVIGTWCTERKKKRKEHGHGPFFSECRGGRNIGPVH